MNACAYLVVATSARALAQSARKGGLNVVALDCFGDIDTLSAANQAEAVPSDGGDFDPKWLLRRAEALCPGPHVGLVYGSGLEHQPLLLGRLARGRSLHGNDAETVARLKRPLDFVDLLAGAEIPHPVTRLERPPCTSGWLVKRIGAGGRRPRATDGSRRTSGRTTLLPVATTGTHALAAVRGRRASTSNGGFEPAVVRPERPGSAVPLWRRRE